MEALSQPPGSPKGAASKLVTEISSGREMSLEEFDRALGLHTALEVAACCGSHAVRGPTPAAWKIEYAK